MGDHIRYTVADGVDTITIDRPEKKNAMTFAMLGEFLDIVAAAGADDACRVLVITGVPGAFCAGTDLADLATIPGKERGLRGGAHETGRWWPILQCPKPTIAAIDGPAIGMGAEFTSQCDLRVATTRTRFAWNFAHRGLVPDTGAGTYVLPRLVGPQRAFDWLYTGRFVTAEEAQAAGYLLDLVEPDALAGRVAELCTAVLAGSPHSQKLIKALVYGGFEADVAGHMANHTAAMAACFRSEDHAEGVAAFLERRPARFTGR